MNFYQTKDGGITFACDGMSALNMVFSTRDITINNPSFDLIYAAWKKSPKVWTTRHVAGHRDEDKSHVLGEWGKLNVQADEMAKSFIPFAMMQPRHFSMSLGHYGLVTQNFLRVQKRSTTTYTHRRLDYTGLTRKKCRGRYFTLFIWRLYS